MYLGDFVTGDVVYIERCFVDGNLTPTAVVGGSACCKKMDSSTPANSGVGAITTSGGQCTLAIFTGSATAYYNKGDYTVYMGKGTVTGTSVIGYTLAQFSIGRTTAITYSSNVLQWNSATVATPNVSGVPKVDLVDWLGSAPNALIAGRVDANANAAIAATTVSANVLQWNGSAVSSAASGIPKVDVDTIKTNPVVNGGTFTFPTNATGASTTNITAGTITTVTNLTNAPTAGDFTSTMKTSIQTAVTAVTLSADVKQWLTSTPNALISGRVDANVNATITATTLSATVLGLTTAGATAIENAVWDATLASHLSAGSTGAGLNSASSAGDPWNTAIPGAYGAGTAGKLLGNAINSSTFTMSANVTSINAVSTSAVTTVKAVQGLTTADTVALTSAYDFAKGTVAMTESYAADTAAMTPVQALHMLWANAAQFAITSTSISVKKLDGTTEAMNFDLDSSTTPTLRNRNV